ncbi:uncharacterized protein DSM5745_08667 [Aspergillus mulundensis]|uniref:Uncharacterized protein n=1 Tax=Aspergillus mulundensis TaxID=1810919 RepID=A0A3D8R4K4_9EURO|nr:hypothetical protein DSM5745_08667 [Aspergillus mulundensis]RDW68907.1 hypothetical protein DSM5745_08667 [Aspergillus mulundensis]
MDQQKLPVGAVTSADVARILDDAKVPSLLMGDQVMGFYKEPADFGDLIFVVEDDQVEEAKDALDAAFPAGSRSTGIPGYEIPYGLCTEPECIELEEDRTIHEDYTFRGTQAPKHPKSEHHFHTELQNVVIHIMRKTDLLWWLPRMTLDMPDKNHAYLTVSTNRCLPQRGANQDDEEGGPCGPWRGLYPVRILKPGRLIEALCWLWMRDCREFGDGSVSRWIMWNSMLVGMREQWKKAQGAGGKIASLWHTAADFERAFKWHGGEFPDSVRRHRGWGGSPYQIALLKLRDKLMEEGGFPIELCVQKKLPEFDLADDEKQRFPWLV